MTAVQIVLQARHSQTQQQSSRIQISKDSSMKNYVCAYQGKSHLRITPMFQCVLKLWPHFILVASRSALAGDELPEQGCSPLEHAVTPVNRCALPPLYLCISPLKALQSHVRGSQNTTQPEQHQSSGPGFEHMHDEWADQDACVLTCLLQ